MSSKLRTRIGEVEIDYEGTEGFLKQEPLALLKTGMELHKAAGPAGGGKASNSADGGKGRGTIPTLTTGTIAARLKAKSGPTLLMAAAVHLTFVASKSTFSRQELLTEMQSATSHYKKSYSNNLRKYLSGAVAEGKLQESAKNTYALSADTKSVSEKSRRAERDVGAGEVKHREEVVGLLLPADQEAAEAVEPGVRAFDDPAPRAVAGDRAESRASSPRLWMWSV